MRVSRVLLAGALITGVASTGLAGQALPTTTTFTQLELAVACASPPTLDLPAMEPLRIIGTQETIRREVFGNHDLLVINGGTSAGLQLGQQFFVRRANRFGLADAMHPRGARTVAWIRIVAVNESTAIATFDHMCAAVVRDDYLEPFVAPVIPAGADRDEAPGEPDFTQLGLIIAGSEDRSEMGAGDFVLVDRGTEQGIQPGSHFALYRDVGGAGMPLASLGESVVISTSARMSLVRITRARDAVKSGDYVALRK